MSKASNAGVGVGVAAGIFAIPFIALFAAFFRAAVLFWPFMLLVGALHNQPGWEWVPAIGWWVSVLILAIASFLLPSSSAASSKS